MEISETSDECSNSTEAICINDALHTKEKTVDDDRIDCTNSYYLNKIYEVALRHVTKLAESHLNEGRSQFINRFSEVFKNIMQENVSVKGLPYVVHEENLTVDEKQEQKQETIDELLSKLSKTVEKTAEKRKIIPQHCSRIYNVTSKHERQNLKRAKIELEHPTSLPSFSSSPRPVLEDPSKELTAICKNISSAQKLIEKQEQKLLEIQKQVELAKNIHKQHYAHSEILYDTGYISE